MKRFPARRYAIFMKRLATARTQRAALRESLDYGKHVSHPGTVPCLLVRPGWLKKLARRLHR